MQANPSAGEEIASINVTPLVDVALVLVIVFMITLPTLMERGLKAQSSDQKVVPVSTASAPILVELSEKGLSIEGKATPLQELPAALRGLMAQRHVNAVSLQAARSVSHGDVVRVLDKAMSSGATDVSLIEPKKEEAGHGPS